MTSDTGKIPSRGEITERSLQVDGRSFLDCSGEGTSLGYYSSVERSLNDQSHRWSYQWNIISGRGDHQKIIIINREITD